MMFGLQEGIFHVPPKMTVRGPPIEISKSGVMQRLERSCQVAESNLGKHVLHDME